MQVLTRSIKRQGYQRFGERDDENQGKGGEVDETSPRRLVFANLRADFVIYRAGWLVAFY